MTTAVQLDEGLGSRLRRLAGSRDRSPDAIVDDAVREYLEREEARDRFHAEAVNSWDAFQRTRQHLTGDEVQSWLQSWGTPDEKPAPDCHG